MIVSLPQKRLIFVGGPCHGGHTDGLPDPENFARWMHPDHWFATGSSDSKYIVTSLQLPGQICFAPKHRIGMLLDWDPKGICYLWDANAFS